MNSDILFAIHGSAALLAATACLRPQAYALGSACASIALADVAYAVLPIWQVHTVLAFLGPLTVVLVAARLAALGTAIAPVAAIVSALGVTAVLGGPFLDGPGIAWLLVAAHAFAGIVGLTLIRMAPSDVPPPHVRLVSLYTATCAPGVVGHVCLALGYSMRPAVVMDIVFLAAIVVCCLPWTTPRTWLLHLWRGSRFG